MATTLCEHARDRIRAEMQKKHLSQRDVAGMLNWSQSRVAKLMTGRVEMGLTDLEGLCFAVGLSPVEAVRDPGMQFCAEMTPTELRLLQQLRHLPRDVFEAMLLMIGFKAHTLGDVKKATPAKRTKIR